MATTKTFVKTVRRFVRSKWNIGFLMVVIAGGGFYYVTSRDSSKYQFVSVTRGTITETVLVTGSTIPLQSVSLVFGNSGTIAQIYAAIGMSARRGQLLAVLNTTDLYAQVRSAEANVDIQRAKLGGLRAGARAEDIAASKAAFDKAEQDLANMFTGISDISIDSYTKANDAVRTQLSGFFSNAETGFPQLTYLTSNAQSKLDAEFTRASITEKLNLWQAALLSVGQSPAAFEALLQQSVINLLAVRELLSSVSKTLEGNTNLAVATLAEYMANNTTAFGEVNTALKNLNTASQNIASQKLTVAQAEAQLRLKQAGTRREDIQAAEAEVKSAEASLESARAKIANSQIISPISGVITQFDAKIGQTASPGETLISIISEAAFEIEAIVSEIDVGKITIGNRVTMSLDAFPSETFTGKVYYIDPAQTASEGVVGYKIKISFDAKDPRMKSGLTANLEIETRRKESALIAPQYAILQNDEGTFVERLVDGAPTTTPVTLGIQDSDGNVEILSGVTEGQQVLNIGLKR